MNLVIINGSPRVKKYSNTDKIITAFCRGYCENGNTYELYSISDRSQWEQARNAFEKNTEILMAIPLYAENIPGLMLEFLETLSTKTEKGTKISFILQGGFAEGCQLRCGEKFLEKLSSYLGCIYGGALIKGDNFAIRIVEGEECEKILKPYEDMGKLFAREKTFDNEEAKAFTGPEKLSFFTKMILRVVFKTVAKKRYRTEAEKWGCFEPIDAKPYL